IEVAFLIWTEPSPVGSVFIEVSGAINSTQLENVVPYTAFGNDGWNGMNERTLVVGQYTLTATAYTEANRGGQICTQESVTFTVMDSRQAPNNAPPEGNGHPPGSEGPGGDENPPAEPSEPPPAA